MQRLKNEWPNGVFRQSSDEKMGLSRQTYDGGGSGRNQQFSSDSDDSRGRLARATCVIRSDSDSDSDPKKWTKNPLVVRRVKRSDKLKQAEKRVSATDNVFSTNNRDSLISQSNEENRKRSANVSVRDASSKDEGSGSRSSSKYQKLEQMRKMRLNLSVTSDEENVPQRPQPHRWSGPNIRNFTVPNKDTEPVSHQGMVRSQFSQEFYKAVNSPPAFAPQPYLPASHNTQPSPAGPLYHLKQHVQPGTAKTSSPGSNVNTGLNRQPGASGLGQTTGRLSHTQTQGASHFPDSSVTSSRQAFHPLSRLAGSENTPYRTAEISSPRIHPTDFSNSSNVTTHRFTSQVHVPSIDSKTSASTSHSLMASHHPTYFNARQTPPQDRLQPAAASRPSSYSTAGLEKRPTATNKNESKLPQKIPRKMLSRSGVPDGNDSLDELVESNIQYLSSDVDQAKPKKSSTTNVTRFSSLPAHGKTTSRVVSSTPPQDQASIQVQASTSIQLHVTLPAETARLGTSLIQIAPSVDHDYRPSFGYRQQLTSQPDLIPRNFSQSAHASLPQTRNDYNNGSMTTALSQTDARAGLPSHITLGTMHTRTGFGDKKPRSDTEISRHAPTLDKGMFSDVEYDIEVSQRVKKWETLMKVRDLVPTSDKKDLIPINENLDSDPFMDPSRGIHKAVMPSKQTTYASSYIGESNQPIVPRVLSMETNARRFFQVIPDPRLNIKSQDVNSRMFQTPLSLRPEKTFTSASDLRQQVLANRLHPLPVTSGPVQVTYKPPLPVDNGQQASSQRDTPYSGQVSSQRDTPYSGQVSSQRDTPYSGQVLSQRDTPYSGQVSSQRDTPYSGQQVSAQRETPYSGQQASSQRDTPYGGQQASSQRDTPLVKRTSNVNDARNSEKRGSKYREEIHEISNMKSDSVGNLRRRFDTDSTNATSEDDKKSVSTASAKLSLPSKEYSSQSESTDWSQVLPSYHTKVKDSEVWSPNLESTQGVSVSIERVTARTLQTIPFSDDPFWKEIEQMTTFDPASKEGMLTIEPIRSHHQVQLIPPQSFTLPIQPHRNVSSVVDKMQKSKSLYTPNITPLSVDVSGKPSSNAANALDDVLSDINRSPVGRKQLSPKKRSSEVDFSPTNAATSDVSRFLKTRPKSGQFGQREPGQLVFVNLGAGNMAPTRTLASGLRGPNRLDMLTTQQQPLQFSQQQQPLQFSQQQQPLQFSQQQQPLQFSQQQQPLQFSQQQQPLQFSQQQQPLQFSQQQQPLQFSQQQQPLQFSQQQQPLQFSQQQPLQFSQQQQPLQFSQQQQPLQFSQQQQPLQFSQQQPLQFSQQQQPLQFSQQQEPLQFSQQQQPLQFSQQQQPLQFSQQPRQQPQPNTTNRQTSQGFTNNYQLDPNLLKQKLLKTGLVVEPDMEERGDRGHYQSPSLDRPAHDILNTGNITAQPFSVIASKQHSDARLEEPIATTSSPHVRSSDISAASKNIFLQPPGKQPGSKTLDEIQKALAPFSSTTYQPGPETLYGASTLQAFRDKTCDTSKGSHTSATGWSYHTQPNTDNERSNTADSSLSGGSSRLQEVNESMDDLTNLARDVELRINEIKNKLQTADETSLDNILLSLRRLTPEVRSQETDTATCENYYEKKKSKLSDALSELDRIYTVLELNPVDTNTLHKTEKPQSDAASYVRGPQPRSVHLRPMQTRISSVFIRDIDANKMPESQEKESEFDVISKSFQAIVDEVNQTTDLLSRAVERSKQDNVAPETHKHKSTVKPGHAGKEMITTANSSAQSDTGPAAQNSITHMLNSAKETVGDVTNTASLPSSSGQHQTRFRPVKDNKIIQDDIATRKDSDERVLRVIPSPKPSPTLIRKLLTGDQVAQTKQHVPPNDASVKQTAELQNNVKEQTQLVEDKDACKSDLSVQPSPSSSKNKAVPSVENNQTETLVLDSNDGTKSKTSPYLAAKSQADKLATTPQTTTAVSKTTNSNNASGGLRLSSTSASTASSIFVPAVTNSKQSRLAQAGTKCEEFESTSKEGNKTKRPLGSGVAMMLGRFSSSQESIDGSKKGPATRSGDQDGSGEDNTEKEDVSAAAPPAETAEGQGTSEANMKSPIRSSTNVKPIRSYDVKPAALSSLERKLLDRESTLLNSGASSPQPCSPVNKPPPRPWTRHTSDPEKQSVADAIKAYSPKFVSKIPRPASSNGSTASDGYFTPKELDSPRQVVGSPVVATSKERPPVWKCPNSSPRGRGRPHSFHELISVFERDSPNKLQTLDKFRKCASAGEVSSNNALAGKGFRCEDTVNEEPQAEK